MYHVKIWLKLSYLIFWFKKQMTHSHFWRKHPVSVPINYSSCHYIYSMYVNKAAYILDARVGALLSNAEQNPWLIHSLLTYLHPQHESQCGSHLWHPFVVVVVVVVVLAVDGNNDSRSGINIGSGWRQCRFVTPCRSARRPRQRQGQIIRPFITK